jgi:amidohydrolase
MSTLTNIVDHAIGIRRQIHQHPELRYKEHNTAKVVRAELDRLGIPWTACANTGTLGRLAVGKKGKHLAFRADLDALPLKEQTGLPYASRIEGMMHACGHDGHTASLLAAGAYLKSREADLAGPVTLLFQPAEEVGHGAKAMIEDGALEGIDEVYGYHNWPPIPFGQVACPPGPVMASNGEWEASIAGRGGHAAQPQNCIDPIATGAAFVTMVQQVVSRQVSPSDAAVVSVTCFHGGTADNIIPDKVDLVGTVRAATTGLRDDLARRTEHTLNVACQLSGAKASFTYRPCYPATVNDPAAAGKAADAVRRVVGAQAVVNAGMPIMASEDFAYYLQVRPGAYLLIGSGKPGQTMEPCHSPRFDYNEDLIPIVVKLWADLAGVPLK